jgi:hypothetical protein
MVLKPLNLYLSWQKKILSLVLSTMQKTITFFDKPDWKSLQRIASRTVKFA